MRDLHALFVGGCADGLTGPVEVSPVMVAVVDDRPVALTPRAVSGRHNWDLYEVDLDAAPDPDGRVPYRYVRPA